MAFRLQWPTKTRRITQHFLDNPENYAQFNLPGHEGLDLSAGRGAEIFACADGVVTEAVMGDDKHPYGQRVRLRHDTPDGVYKTVYAHLLDVVVEVDQHVTAGQLIGHADNTGNSFGNHLHLTLKKQGATAAGQTTFITADGRICTMENDIIDPTPYLDPPPKSIPVRSVLNGVVVGLEEIVALNVLPEPTITVISTPRPDHPLRGLHGERGADWMRDNQIKGWAVETVYAGGDLVNPCFVDYSAHQAAGVRVLVRWNYSFAKADGGLGTYPTRDLYPQFIDWCIRSISGSAGVWGHIIGNEPNRAGERADPNDPITPQDIVMIYNSIWERLPKATRVSPPAIDPTNVETANPIEYWREIVRGLKGVEFFALHAYSYGADQAVDSTERFGHEPMTWQFHSFRMWQTLANVIFSEFKKFIPVPLIITETNHLYLRGSNLTTPGWDDDSETWIQNMYDYVTGWNRGPGGQYVHGVCLYRFAGDAWGIEGRHNLLGRLGLCGEFPL